MMTFEKYACRILQCTPEELDELVRIGTVHRSEILRQSAYSVEELRALAATRAKESTENEKVLA